MHELQATTSSPTKTKEPYKADEKIQLLHFQGLRTPNEGINQRNLKFWADLADKISFGRIYKFEIGI